MANDNRDEFSERSTESNGSIVSALNVRLENVCIKMEGERI